MVTLFKQATRIHIRLSGCTMFTFTSQNKRQFVLILYSFIYKILATKQKYRLYNKFFEYRTVQKVDELYGRYLIQCSTNSRTF